MSKELKEWTIQQLKWISPESVDLVDYILSFEEEADLNEYLIGIADPSNESRIQQFSKDLFGKKKNSPDPIASTVAIPSIKTKSNSKSETKKKKKQPTPSTMTFQPDRYSPITAAPVPKPISNDNRPAWQPKGLNIRYVSQNERQG